MDYDSVGVDVPADVARVEAVAARISGVDDGQSVHRQRFSVQRLKLATMKYIFVTGGVVSSLGKGLTAASLGTLLENRGLKVALQKFDPYLNVDPGTMSPYQHGEVYVLDDGAETDLDLGHYERFTNCKLTRLNNLTSGQVYQTVLNNEREGKYLGKTVQVIPHVTDEIQNRIHVLAEQTKADVIITEIGGTTGDIEGLPFLEAIREFALEVGPAQRAVRPRHLRAVHQGRRRTEDQAHPAIGGQAARNRHRAAHPGLPLREAAGQGTAPEDFPVLQRAVRGGDRGEGRGPQHLRSAADAPARARGRPGLPACCTWTRRRPTWRTGRRSSASSSPRSTACASAWSANTSSLQDAYKSVYEAIIHGGIANDCGVEIQKVDAEDIERDGAEKHLKGLGGILVPGGFGERGIEGKIQAARYARENNVPYLGLCLGMQIATIEFARNVLKLAKAHSTEFDPNTPHPVIAMLDEQTQGDEEGRHHAAGRAAVPVGGGHQGGAALRRVRGQGTPPPPLRVQQRLPRAISRRRASSSAA